MRAFNEIRSSEAFSRIEINIKNEIEGKAKEYILSIDEHEYISYLVNNYTLEPVAVYFEKESYDAPIVRREWKEDRYGERYLVDNYTFKVEYPYTGSAQIFRLYPSRRSMTTYDIDINESTNIVSFQFILRNQDKDEFFRVKNQCINDAFVNLDNANNDVIVWNSGLQNLIHSIFNKQKAKYLKENDFFSAINIPFDRSTQSIFTPPTIKKKDIPQPIANKTQEFSSEPTMSSVMYSDILKIINDAGKSMERKPSLYIGKDEEGLRDQFLFILETRYDAITATGETFNRSGKTDIILKYAKDGSNLFVAECKFWTGAQGFLNTITQLFERYLTWRDSKVAVIMFVRNNDFTSVLKNISTEVRNHAYYVRDNGRHADSSFSYIFRLPEDSDKHVNLEVIAFHYDKK